MKKNYMFKGAIIAMFAASFVACQSTPEATEAPAEEAPVEEVVEEAPVEEVAADTAAVEATEEAAH